MLVRVRMAEEGLHGVVRYGHADSPVLGLLRLLLVHDQEEGERGVVWETSRVKICIAMLIRKWRPLRTTSTGSSLFFHCLHAL